MISNSNSFSQGHALDVKDIRRTFPLWFQGTASFGPRLQGL